MSALHALLKRISKLGFLLMMGVNMNADASSTFTWKEEVLLHDGGKIIVQRFDIYDPSMRHEIGQAAPLAEHKTMFTIPGTNQSVVWRSDNRSFSEPEHLNLLVLDFIDGVPYTAATIGGPTAYKKWGSPNPPYVFFKFTDRWQRISLEEFPEKFKINLTVTGRKIDNLAISNAIRKFGFVPAQAVEQINLEPGRSRESYKILRVPLDYGPPSSGYLGPKAPYPITPPNTTGTKK